MLVARSKGLEKVKAEITSAVKGGGAGGITIHLVVADLGDLASLSAVFSQCSEKADPRFLTGNFYKDIPVKLWRFHAKGVCRTYKPTIISNFLSPQIVYTCIYL